jgi:psiF repeat
MLIAMCQHSLSTRARSRVCATWEKGLGMKGLVATVCALVSILGVPSKPPAYALTPQQELMKTCNEPAGNQKLTGDARKSFMSDCLSGKTSSPLTRQQELMKSCNVQATSQKLKGDARKQFMSTCLKG